ncbi:MBL fold metallo-hydrolase [Lacticaseibacillus mingshuiensis]|uniref:MBL fold metallo-hydrolase n=1 Tax=Lacticaseibacillus mingshuiensis TaxID=2799574 RepID=UPI00195165D9|nr:MBL fold metallo-hydrolase [Lacticaseibacillus mingshuiensis]
MTQIRFLNGLTTIGGNIVEFSNGDSRVIMDFGVAADLTNETIESAMAAGKLPQVPELFGEGPDTFAHEAIFISHLHIDHMGALQYLKRDIPIYLSAPSYQLYQTLIALGVEKPVANLHPLPFETPIQIGAFSVEGFASDHDEPGVMALLVSDGTRWFGHSGDVRLNGPHLDRVKKWAAAFRDKKLAMFMVEGTTFSFDSPAPVEDSAHPSVPLTEDTLQERLEEQLKAAPQLVVINPYIRNYARLQNIQATAHRAGRQMVWGKNDAAVLKTMCGVEPDFVLDEDIHLRTIQADPNHYLLQNDFDQLAQLADLPISVYLHSNGEPLGDYDPRFKQLQDWLSDHEIPLVFLSCSGHALRQDLVTLVRWIAPQIVVPWHSFHPEREAQALDEQTKAQVLLPEKDLYYDLDEPDQD